MKTIRRHDQSNLSPIETKPKSVSVSVFNVVAGKYFKHGTFRPENLDGGYEFHLLHIVEVEQDYDLSSTIKYQHKGQIYTCSKLDFQDILETGKYTDVTATVEMQNKAKRNKLNNPNYKEVVKLIGHSISSDNKRYTAYVESIDQYTISVKVKITVHGLDVESSFYKNFPLTGFTLESIFTPIEVDNLNMIYGPAYDETLLGVAVAKKMDKDNEEQFWVEISERGKALGMSDEIIEIAKNTVRMNDMEKEKTAKPIDLNDRETPDFSICFEKELKADVNDRDLGHVDAKTNKWITGKELNEKLTTKNKTMTKQNLFEVIGTLVGKDEKFTIIAEDINADLVNKIFWNKPDIQIFSIKRISAIDII